MLRLGYISDLHWGEAGTDYLSRVPDLVAALNGHDLDAVVCGGDQIHDSSNAGVVTMRVAELVAELNKLACPWHWVWGNHDFARSSVQTALTDFGIDHGAPRVIPINGYKLVLFDSGTGLVGGVPSDDLAWFETTFAVDTTPLLVFVHHSLLTTDPSIKLSNSAAFLSTMRSFGNVRGIYSAHDHGTNQVDDHEGIPVVQSQRGGGSWGLAHGFRTIHGAQVIIENRAVSLADDSGSVGSQSQVCSESRQAGQDSGQRSFGRSGLGVSKTADLHSGQIRTSSFRGSQQ